ncbi:hypothetical protein Bsp3421_000334 (plasmid) [Burkholderia sp. FERM BP-3421]|uniref:phage integrase family protein n=1 Tax=Burkholderia sp. FERM BP-3421 TaxID=1494466 RepID=UPI00235E79B6|nr:phage integrase family protein [Burkholderia sp. FERM BP-3421]WDD90487.1 hypothetical protein Bsp3421_000334 [Burkholderia sp. FERM BP-3421]
MARWFRARCPATARSRCAPLDSCNRRRGSWWRSVPRIGVGRARTVVAWLRRHAETMATRSRSTSTASIDSSLHRRHASRCAATNRGDAEGPGRLGRNESRAGAPVHLGHARPRRRVRVPASLRRPAVARVDTTTSTTSRCTPT